ncbi:hypothetical protein R2R35_05090 [Anaerocolumna sp. AGMB13020]|uniref:hypothetical protein n=1 Tax=Anaerocolumna sp. AGMB13020 TaxID=3081750 RepID=UPI002954675B|nr:hypothetical protein [Anaerocolumna sp. AGMB13020]WOO37880.1 hypothetical protein R2R35_05090 [Anaerocolumna sp. AGMB13020]
MVRQLGREIIDKYTWLERSNITMGYSANLLFDFADLDDLCKDIEGELDAHSLGAGFTSQGQRIDEFVEHRSALLSYTSDVLYDIDEYLENPLYKGFNNAMDMMATIDMRDAKTDNSIGLQEHTSMYVGAGMYDEVGGDMLSLNLEDFIGNRNKDKSLTNYQKVDDFADLFAKDYENLVNNDKIDPNEETLQEYLDSLVLKEFAHKKDSPFWKELLESLSEMTVVIPMIEAATGKTLITGDYLTGDEQAFKVVSGVVSLATLGYGAAIAKGGGALAKMFAADILAEVVSGSTVIVCDKAGVPSTVTVALAILLGSTTGMIADKALLKNTPLLKNGIEIDDTVKYKKYWDDVANGKYDIPYGMTSEEYAQYLKGMDKVDKAIKRSDDVIKGGSNSYGSYSTKIDTKVTVINKQELPNSLVKTFKDGNYRTVVTNEDITVYRSFGHNAEAGGAFATSNPALNRIQTKVDSAILPEWKNTLKYEAEIVIPKGSTLNIGRVEEQFTMSGARLAGDADQFLLPQNWDLNWIKSIREVKP